MNAQIDDYTLSESLPTIQKQIDALQANLQRPSIMNQTDIAFLLLTARLGFGEEQEWEDFLAHLGITREMGDAYLNLGQAVLSLEDTLQTLDI